MFLAPLTRLLAAAGILPLSPAPVEPIGALNVQDGGAGSLTFTLRQTHAMSPTHPGRVVWRDLASDSSFKPEDNAFTLSTKQVKSLRPRSLEAFHAARMLTVPLASARYLNIILQGQTRSVTRLKASTGTSILFLALTIPRAKHFCLWLK